ncbi:hypothetical protein MKX08_003694 [Trichoderma sp. CBMAI-0020]|nr:hypothetical protein MKX08_003694 [Trichoderma sp. CBMAI-0020]WOD46212.1 hypothetical protein [Trichoderma atroviride]
MLLARYQDVPSIVELRAQSPEPCSKSPGLFLFAAPSNACQIPRILVPDADGALPAFGAHLRQSDASGVTQAGPPGPLDDHSVQISRAGLRWDSFAGQCGGAVRRARLVWIGYQHMPPHRQSQNKTQARLAASGVSPAEVQLQAGGQRRRRSVRSLG